MENTVTWLLERSFQVRHNRVAVRLNEDAWTYGQLEARADELAEQLAMCGATPGARIAVALRKSFDLYATLVAIYKSQLVYCPIDNRAVGPRMRSMLVDLDAKVVVCDARSRASSLGAQVGVCLDVSEPAPRTTTTTRPWARPQPDEDALVLFTSGSTGSPKGVLMSHANLFHIIDWTLRHFQYDESDVINEFNTTHFDMSVEAILLALCAGGTIAAYPEDVFLPKDMLRLTYGYGITRLSMMPSTLSAWVRSGVVDYARLGTVKDLLVGGEIMPPAIVREIMRCLPACRVHNQYGPTEATSYVSMHTYDAPPSDDSLPPIGTPVPGNHFILEDVQDGIGELVIAGVQVAQGYLNDAAKTKASFGIDRSGVRTYRTGDLASRDPATGRYVFCGRRDRQIKYRGNRVELGEIENAMAQVPGVIECAVNAVRQDGSDEVRSLEAFYVGADDLSGAIIDHLRGCLPNYMVPTSYVRLEALPKTSTMKVDREALAKHGR